MRGKNFNHRVFADLRHRLLTGRLAPGQAVNVGDIAEELVVSVAPIRDALLKLTERGLIQHFEGRGFFVTALTTEDTLELLGVLAFVVRNALARNRYTLAASPEYQGAGTSKADQTDAPRAEHLSDQFLESICSPTTVGIARGAADRVIMLVRGSSNISQLDEEILCITNALTQISRRQKLPLTIRVVDIIENKIRKAVTGIS